MLTNFTFVPAKGVTRSIRVMTVKDAPWFVAADACPALGLRPPAVRPFTPHRRRLG